MRFRNPWQVRSDVPPAPMGERIGQGRRTLFYLSPWTAQGNLLFYEGALRKKIMPQLRRLIEQGHAVSLLVSEILMERIDWQEASDDLVILPIPVRDLMDWTDGVGDRQAELYRQPDGELSHRLEAYFRTRIAEAPDIIVAWETPVPFLQRLFPDALVVHQMPGMVSRVPYPETLTMDPEGLFRHGIAYRFAHEILRYEPSTFEREFVLKMCDHFRRHVTVLNPFERRRLDPLGRFRALLLVPLQVTDHYAFRIDAPFGSQIDFLIDVLERVPEDVGVVATQYITETASDRPLRGEVLSELRRRYRHLVYDEDFDRIDNVSQYLLSAVDAVCTASSSIGMQALIWRRPLVVPYDTHLVPYADARTLELDWSTVESLATDRSHVLAFFFARYQPLLVDVLRGKHFLAGQLDLMLERKRGGARGLDLLPRYVDQEERYDRRFFASAKIDRALERLVAAYGEGSSLTSLEALRRFATSVLDPKIAAISFDVFDTLIDRPLEAPAHLFKLIETHVEERSGGKVRKFHDSRIAAEQAVRRAAEEAGILEITLEQIYDEIAALHHLTPIERATIRDLEIETERALIRERRYGRKLYDLAQASGKPVVLISDMYLPRSVIEDLLAQTGYRDYNALFVSSAVGCRKHDGGLFISAANWLGLAPAEILHVGDNPVGDVKKAREAGLVPWFVQRSIVTMLRNTRFRELFEGTRRSRTVGQSVYLGLVARGCFDDPCGRYYGETHFNRDTFNLGYIALGPVIVAFAQWLHGHSRRDHIEHLYFLSRDGDIMKRVFDALYSGRIEAPKTSYILSSRRAARVASIRTRSDLLELVQSQSHHVSLGDFLTGRLGLDLEMVDPQRLHQFGFGGLNHLIRTTEDREALRELVIELEAVVLANAYNERSCMRDYLLAAGLGGPGRNAVVDIGYAGTMQAAIKGILERPQLAGYYFITFDSARRQTRNGEIVRGFAGDFVDEKTYEHPICRYGLFFESLFCNSNPSFVRFRRQAEGGLQPVFQDQVGDGARQRLIEQVHLGAEVFARDVARHFSAYLDDFSIDPYFCVRTLVDFIERPSGRDAELFEGVRFDDTFGGAGIRYVVPPRQLGPLTPKLKSQVVWRQGTEVLFRRPDVAAAKCNAPASLVKVGSAGSGSRARFGNNPMRGWLDFERRLVKLICDDRKYEKYARSKQQFFADAHLGIVRWYGRLTTRHRFAR